MVQLTRYKNDSDLRLCIEIYCSIVHRFVCVCVCVSANSQNYWIRIPAWKKRPAELYIVIYFMCKQAIPKIFLLLLFHHENVVCSFHPIDFLYIFHEYRFIWTGVIWIGQRDFVSQSINGKEHAQYLTYMWGVREKKWEQKFCLGEKPQNSNGFCSFMAQGFCKFTSLFFTAIKTITYIHTDSFFINYSIARYETFFIQNILIYAWTAPLDTEWWTGNGYDCACLLNIIRLMISVIFLLTQF